MTNPISHVSRLETSAISSMRRYRAVKKGRPGRYDDVEDMQTAGKIGLVRPHLDNEEIYHFEHFIDFVNYLERDTILRRFNPEWSVLHYSKQVLASDTSINQLRIDEFNDVFNSVRRFEQALYLARNGWHEGVKRVQEWELELTNSFNRKVELPTFYPNLTGGDVDVDAYLRGEPENMIDFLPADTRFKSPRILVDVNVRCEACGRRAHDHTPTPPDWVMIRGAALSILVKMLRRYNYRPEVILGTVSYHPARHFPVLPKGSQNITDPKINYLSSPKKRTTLVTLFKPGDVFDIQRIVFALAHDSFVRKLQFRFEEILNLSEYGGIPFDKYVTPHINHNGDSPHLVGWLPIGWSHQHYLRPSFDYDRPLTDRDIYIPSVAEYIDIGKESGQYAHQSMTESPFGTVEGATEWLLNTLESQGIVFK